MAYYVIPAKAGIYRRLCEERSDEAIQIIYFWIATPASQARKDGVIALDASLRWHGHSGDTKM